MIQLANKKFALVGESNVKDIGSNTLLTVNQDGELLYGEYAGGRVIKGSFIARLSSENTFKRYFHHMNNEGVLISGVGCGSIEVLSNGKIRLKESWDLNTHFSGDAIYDEIDLTNQETDNDYFFNLALNK